MSNLDRIISGSSYQPMTRDRRPGEIRDPSAATQSLTYTSPGTRQIPEWDASSAIGEAYLSSVIVYACVQVRARAIASCPLRAILPGQDIAEFDPNAPLAKLLGPAPGSPNPSLSSRRLWMNATANYIVTGRFAWELEAPKGVNPKSEGWTPVNIWPLISRVFEVIPTDGGTQLFSGFRYGRGDHKVDLAPSQVFYSYNPSLNDVRQAASALQALRYDIVADVMQAIYDVAFLRNDARPAGLIVHAAFEEASQRRSFEQQFESNHRGPQNAGRMAFAEFEGGDGKEIPFQFINMGLSQKDAMMLATQQDKVQRICLGLGTPMSMLDASGRTFNNGGLEAQNFWTTTVLADLADYEDEINRDLAPRLGPHVAKFDTRHVEALKAPAKFATINLKDAVDLQIIDPEEARTEMGYPARDPEQNADLTGSVGSSMLEQAALITALSAKWDAPTIAKILNILPPDPVSLEAEAPPPPPLLLAPGAITGPATDQSTTWAHALTTIRELSHEATRAERRAATWRAADAQTKAAEGAWVKGIRRLFAKQKATTLSRLESRSARWSKETRDVNPDDVFDPAYQQAQTQDALIGLFETLLGASGARVASQHGFAFDVNDPKVMALIDMRVSKLAEQITGTTYDAIKSVILTGIASGSGIPAIAKGIEAVFEAADSSRATLIARTETIAAAADGALASYQQAVDAGALQGYGKVWITELDNRACPDCVDLDGEQVPFSDQFSDGQDGPPDHPDCLIAGTWVSGPSAVASAERRYTGDVIEITTAGLSLTVTPNHPVLTAKGWVKADLVSEGDQIVRDNRLEREPSSVHPHEHDVPVLIEEVTRAFDGSGSVVTRAVPTTAVDFHGDGTDGEVSVIRTHSLLLDDAHAARANPLSQEPLSVGSTETQTLATLGIEAASLDGLVTASDGGVRSGSVAAVLDRTAPGHHKSISVSYSALLDACIAQAVSDGPTADAVPFGQLLLRDAGSVEFEQILKVRRLPFDGHVYNLQTTDGWFIANGIVVHNCRCAVGAEPMDDTGRGMSAEQARAVMQAIAAGTIRIGELCA